MMLVDLYNACQNVEYYLPEWEKNITRYIQFKNGIFSTKIDKKDKNLGEDCKFDFVTSNLNF